MNQTLFSKRFVCIHHLQDFGQLLHSGRTQRRVTLLNPWFFLLRLPSMNGLAIRLCLRRDDAFSRALLLVHSNAGVRRNSIQCAISHRANHSLRVCLDVFKLVGLRTKLGLQIIFVHPFVVCFEAVASCLLEHRLSRHCDGSLQAIAAQLMVFFEELSFVFLGHAAPSVLQLRV